MLTKPALRGRVRARAAATRTDSILVSFCVYPAPERREKDGGHGDDCRKVAVTRKYFKIKLLRFVSETSTLFVFISLL